MMSFSEQENNDTIALCMIVKNEERNIERSIKSALNLVDEIVIVDTGSTDKTLDLPRSYGAKIFNHKWDNDFSKARNLALENVKSDWILFLDADEELDEYTKSDIHDAIDYENGVANFLYVTENFGGLKTQNAQARLFRNHKNIRYTKQVAEDIYDSLEKLVVEQKREFRVYPIYINHFGTERGDELIQKFSRNMEMLKNLIEEPFTSDEDKAHYYIKLIHYYRLLNVEPKAMFGVVNQAFELIKMVKSKKDKEMVYETDSLYINLHVAEFLIKVKQFDSAKDILKSVLNFYPDSLTTNFLLFHAEIETNNKEEAVRIIKYCKNLIDNYKYFKYEQLMLDSIKVNVENIYKSLVK